MSKPVFSVIIPSVGRPTLAATLRRLRHESDGDIETIVVSDGAQPEARRIAEREGATFIVGPETRHWGNAQRMAGMAAARGRYLLFIDDDDIHRRGAFHAIRGAVAENPDRIIVFRMVRYGEVFWNDPSVRETNLGTPQFLIPNIPGKLGSWVSVDRYESDFDFLTECIELQGEPIFHPEVIALAPPWYRVWRDRKLREIHRRRARRSLTSIARRLIGARRVRRIKVRVQGLETEDRFIDADARCPHPEWWHSRDRNATEVEVTEAVAGLIRALQPEYVVETGTATAQTTIAIGEALRRNGHGRLVSLETDDFLAGHARELCRGLPVEIRQCSSLDFTPEEPIDFAWFDSLPEIRHLEFRRYYPHMHDRTVVGFHDTGPMHPVRAFLDELEGEGLLATLNFPTPRGLTLGRPIGSAGSKNTRSDRRFQSDSTS